MSKWQNALPKFWSSEETFWWHYELGEIDFKWNESIHDLLNHPDYPLRKLTDDPEDAGVWVKCPYFGHNSKALPWSGFNDFETLYPDIAKYWNKEKNDDLIPSMITPWYDKEVWWYYSYDDPTTDKHWDFEWQMKISTIMNGVGKSCICPFLYKKHPWFCSGLNDLGTCCPQILPDWDYENNGDPFMCAESRTSQKSISWVCSKCGHRYNMQIRHKVKSTTKGCEFCTHQGTSFPEQAIYYYVKKFFKDAENRFRFNGFEIDIYIPSLRTGIEYDGTYYHQDISRDVWKNEACIKKNINLIRIREEGCPEVNCPDP